VRFHEGFRLRTANKDGNCSSAYVRRVSGFFKTRILEELPTLQLQENGRNKEMIDPLPPPPAKQYASPAQHWINQN
jgi:hypothetical protein